MAKRAAVEKEHSITLSRTTRTNLLSTPADLSDSYKIDTGYLLGSYSAGNPRPESDIDIYVEPLAAKEYWGFCRELSGRMKLEVDVYTQDDDSDFVEIIKVEGTKIYG